MPVHVYFFMDNILGSIIQYICVIALIIHDIDEKKWGVDMTKAIAKALDSMSLNTNINVNTKWSAENGKILQLVDKFKSKIHSIVSGISQSATKAHGDVMGLDKISELLMSSSKDIKDILESTNSKAKKIKNLLESFTNSMHKSEATQEELRTVSLEIKSLISKSIKDNFLKLEDEVSAFTK